MESALQVLSCLPDQSCTGWTYIFGLLRGIARCVMWQSGKESPKMDALGDNSWFGGVLVIAEAFLVD